MDTPQLDRLIDELHAIKVETPVKIEPGEELTERELAVYNYAVSDCVGKLVMRRDYLKA